MICYLPLSVGYGRGNKTCIKDAGYRFYFNSKYNKCGRFWYFGCGKNQNHFDSPDECEKLCQGNSVEKIKNESKSLSGKSFFLIPIKVIFFSLFSKNRPGKVRDF
jgi:hypothetical protein